MTEVLFYHLERQSLEQVLPGLLEKCLQRDWRVVVQAGTPEQVALLNGHLWTYRENSFLPHGSATDGYEADQPIWLTSEGDTPNQASVLFLIDGAGRDDISGFERCVHIFNGADEAAVQAARQSWQECQGQGFATSYYRQAANGKWEKQNAEAAEKSEKAEK